MKTLFIADLHLSEDNPDITGIFLNFLNSCGADVNALYILGDFFEVWIGDDDQSTFHTQIKQALRDATHKGLAIYVMHGNRDFLLGKKFQRETGCQFLKDPTLVNLYNTPVLLMHGDTLCTQDIAYLKFRKKARNVLFQKLFLWRSLAKRRAIAATMREGSKKHTATTAEYIMDVTQNEVERVMQKHQVKHLIHGHTHRPAIHEFLIDDEKYMRLVLAPWHDEGSVLEWDQSGNIEVKRL